MQRASGGEGCDTHGSRGRGRDREAGHQRPKGTLLNLHRQDGAADGRWMVQLMVVFLLVGIVGTEGFRLAHAGLSVDGSAGRVLQVAADAYASTGSLDRTREAADADATSRGVELVDVTVERNVLKVTVQTKADTLFLHRFFADRGFLNPSATRSTGVRG